MIATVVIVVLFTLACFAIFGILERLAPIDDHQKPILKRNGLKTDLWYWFCDPVWAKVGEFFVILVFILFVALIGWEPTEAALTAGFGPLARLPRAWQVVGSLIVADLAGYSTHRFFHTARMWKF